MIKDQGYLEVPGTFLAQTLHDPQTRTADGDVEKPKDLSSHHNIGRVHVYIHKYCLFSPVLYLYTYTYIYIYIHTCLSLSLSLSLSLTLSALSPR